MNITNNFTKISENNNNIISWNIFSYLGLFFAVIYRFPQIIKIYKSKKADDLSSYSYNIPNRMQQDENRMGIMFILFYRYNSKFNNIFYEEIF